MTSPIPSTRFAALGTTAVVCVTEAGRLCEARDIVLSHVEALDEVASRFRQDSELTALNGRPGRPVPVSSLLYGAIEEALEAAESTGGLVDPTIGRAIRVLGYDRDFEELVPGTSPPRVRVEPVPGWKAVRLDLGHRTVTIARGVELDLGATAKASCADRAALAAATRLGCGVLVNLGGDVAVAGPAPEQGWVVRICDRHDAPPEEPGVNVAIRHGGLATSGTSARRWHRGAMELHHIIDPSSGQPAAGPWRTVTVVAGTCLEANVASTAAVVLGDGAPAWLTERGYHARLADEGGRAMGTNDWPAESVTAGPPGEGGRP